MGGTNCGPNTALGHSRHLVNQFAQTTIHYDALRDRLERNCDRTDNKAPPIPREQSLKRIP